MDLAKAADLATNVMSGYRFEVDQLGRVNDVLAATANSANTNVEQMGEAMSYVAPVAAAANIQFEETSAALGILATNAFQGERGGTALRNIYSTLMTPSKNLTDLTDKYGISIHNAEGEMHPFHEILGQFNDRGVESGEVMKLFGKRAGPAMLALLATGQVALQDYTKELENSEGAAAKMAETQQEGLVGSMTRLSSAVDTLMIRFGEQLAPTVGMLVDRFVGFVGWLTESGNAHQCCRRHSRWGVRRRSGLGGRVGLDVRPGDHGGDGVGSISSFQLSRWSWAAS